MLIEALQLPPRVLHTYKYAHVDVQVCLSVYFIASHTHRVINHTTLYMCTMVNVERSTNCLMHDSYSITKT